MEARNFTTAREMLHDGNWLLTTLNGEPRYQKPPLPTWLTAISAAIFGLKSLTALRLPAALITVVLIVFSYILALKFTRSRTYSFISSLIMATSFYIIFAGRNGQWDIFTHGFMMVCIYQLYLFFTLEKQKYMREVNKITDVTEEFQNIYDNLSSNIKVHIDGDHHDPQVSLDIKSSISLIKKDGFFCCDDVIISAVKEKCKYISTESHYTLDNLEKEKKIKNFYFVKFIRPHNALGRPYTSHMALSKKLNI